MFLFDCSFLLHIYMNVLTSGEKTACMCLLTSPDYKAALLLHFLTQRSKVRRLELGQIQRLAPLLLLLSV